MGQAISISKDKIVLVLSQYEPFTQRFRTCEGGIANSEAYLAFRQIYLALDRQTGRNRHFHILHSRFRPVCSGVGQAGFPLPIFPAL